MPCSLYEIRITGQLDTAAAATFADLSIAASGGITVLRGEFDQASLPGLPERIRALDLDLVDARRVRIPVESASTILSAQLDQSGLHALLDRVRALGLELVDIQRAPDPPPA